MTLGFAGALWTDRDDRVVSVAADTRVSAQGKAFTDAGVKTHELGGRCAMVAAGHALPPMMAAELVRSLVDNHNRRTPQKLVSFFDTVRLVSFFLKRAAEEQRASSQVAVAGFLRDGGPCLASIVVSPGFNRAAFKKVDRGGTVALPVGEPAAGRLLIHAMAEAKRQSRPAIAAAVSMLYYMARHMGAFNSVGGGISTGTCMESSDHFSWPLIEIDGRRFLRGMDVTEYHRVGWPSPEVIPYDEAWCAEQDQRISATAHEDPVAVGTLPGFDIDAISKPETLFASHEEPDLTVQMLWRRSVNCRTSICSRSDARGRSHRAHETRQV